MSTRRVVADSSTLIHLTGIGRLGLLNEFYGTVLLPPRVWREVVEEGEGRPGAEEVRKAHDSDWIEIAETVDGSIFGLLEDELHGGEAEAIALASKTSLPILLDESDAREVAERLGLEVTGVVGILIRAEEEEKLPSLREELDALRNEAGFWISDELYRKALKHTDEVPGGE